MPNMPTDLPENDRALVEAAVAGRVWAPMGTKKPTPRELADPDFVAKMPRVQASTIRALSLGLWDDVRIDPPAVRLQGVRIIGVLKLSFATVQGLLSLEHCHIGHLFVVQQARLPALWLNGSLLERGLNGDGVRIEGDLCCDDGFGSVGEVRLVGAQVGGNVNFIGATLTGVRDQNGVMGRALSADGIEIRGNLFCTNGFQSIGEVCLLSAQIGLNVFFADATLNGETSAALAADRIVVKGDLHCVEGFHSIGEVRLLGAQIGGQIAFDDAQLDGKSGAALNASSLMVGGILVCRGKTHLVGGAILLGARIGGLMDWRPEKWSGRLSLNHAVVGQWCDAWDASDDVKVGQASVTLDHFTYSAFFANNGMKSDSATRIKWVEAAQGDEFTPGPYQTLARVLRAAGDDRGAAAVGLAKARARVKHQAKDYDWPRRWLYLLWMGVLDRAVGHGYRPWKGAGWLAYMLVLGTIIFGLNAPQPYGGPGLIKPADPVFIAQNHIKKPGEYALSEKADKILERGHTFSYALPVEYTPFSAFWYSFDTLIPLIDLGQEKAWSPSPLTSEITKDPAGWALLFYLYIHIIMGWVLTTLTVVALTGLIKRDKEEE